MRSQFLDELSNRLMNLNTCRGSEIGHFAGRTKYPPVQEILINQRPVKMAWKGDFVLVCANIRGNTPRERVTAGA